MRNYGDKITLVKNRRGVYDLDTSKGCFSGMFFALDGCYGDCYANKNAKRYGLDFSKTVLRGFKNSKHEKKIINQINNIDMPFIRIGCSGDPSENWGHCIDICEKLRAGTNKGIIIITKHFNYLTNEQLKRIKVLNLCINTSVSALDNNRQLENKIKQYEILKGFCKSVLRIVSCDFNEKDKVGTKLKLIQEKLFQNVNTLDTVFRPSKNNEFYLLGIIKAEKVKFLDSLKLASVYNKKAYLGRCDTCPDMCGIDI